MEYPFTVWVKFTNVLVNLASLAAKIGSIPRASSSNIWRQKALTFHRKRLIKSLRNKSMNIGKRLGKKLMRRRDILTTKVRSLIRRSPTLADVLMRFFIPRSKACPNTTGSLWPRAFWFATPGAWKCKPGDNWPPLLISTKTTGSQFTPRGIPHRPKVIRTSHNVKRARTYQSFT